jgi:hypothetical protein
MGQELHKHTLKKGLFTTDITFIADVKKIKGKKYGMQLGGFETKKAAEAWMKHLKTLDGGLNSHTRYSKPGALAVAREGRKGPWAVWCRED